ncbi:hypothetical protein KCH_45530 [Kitasatospora cheerisanensis KCTC 2395]|uniref:Uncharacterized protein n=1 Tax=Kitasatospora cheerisanensis KCTC 2395 TaxID=1348663 RepID=A0A066YV96_9ACTN|nr:hypothetical protein KCH_45530 [Kitasatospora cheerisanensis KCTC 2395]
MIHGLARGGLLLGEPDFLAAAQALVPGALSVAGSASSRPGRPTRNPHADVPLGTAGLLLNLLRLRRAAGAGHPDTDEAIRTLAAGALDRLGEENPPFDFRELVPGGADSIAAALARTLAEAPALLADPGPSGPGCAVTASPPAPGPAASPAWTPPSRSARTPSTAPTWVRSPRPSPAPNWPRSAAGPCCPPPPRPSPPPRPGSSTPCPTRPRRCCPARSTTAARRLA